MHLGRELGRGGEGAVFEIAGSTASVAKLYHRLPSVERQAKLKFMALATDHSLREYAAWPLDTLHEQLGGPVLGFLMPSAAGRVPVHHLASPAHRRLERPEMSWQALLVVARNVAAAFDSVHVCGHVIGDVNESNVVVGNDGRVGLLDTDSFQVFAGSQKFFCEVGVGMFTPPELQGIASFKGVVRTPNHDAFGLAILLFQLLLGGRHPYSGVPLTAGVGDTIESNIKALRYAFAAPSQRRGVAPPPRAVPLGILPDFAQAMFATAFTEVGRDRARPSAAEWVRSLDAVRQNVARCSSNDRHVYSRHLSACPWCALDGQGVVLFVAVAQSTTATHSFPLDAVWRAIESVSEPIAVELPSPVMYGPAPRPLPVGLWTRASIRSVQAILVTLGIVMGVAAPNIVVLVVLGVLLSVSALNSQGGSQRQAEQKVRHNALAEATKEYDGVCALAREASAGAFSRRRAELQAAKSEYAALGAAEASEIAKLHSSARDRQLKKFLDRYFISSASIPGIGPTRTATLRSFGIETAADIEVGRITQIQGFGSGLAGALVAWRNSCSRNFVFDANKAVTPADIQAVRGKMQVRRATLEAALREGATELGRVHAAVQAQAHTLKARGEAAAKALAQARADVSLL